MVISITRSNSKIKYLDLPINDPLKENHIENAKTFFMATRGYYVKV